MNTFVKGLVFLGIAFSFTVSSAYAHVTINPREATVGYSVATVRVPNEKDIPTTSIRVVVPEGVNVMGVKPVPGWTVSFTREDTQTNSEEGEGHEHNASGRILDVRWSGGEIIAGEFQEFPLSVQYTGAGEIAWTAYQMYADGEVVPWDDSKGEEYPSSKITVFEQAKIDTLAQDVSTLGEQQSSNPSLWLSVGAILLSAGALFVSLRKK